MDLVDIRGQIETEITWRMKEVVFLENQLENIPDKNDRKIYRKSLVVTLYSHYEGFCKIAFEIYANAINTEKLKCSDVNHSIRMASLNDVFAALERPSKPHAFFKTKFPDDTKLHRSVRRVDFLKSIADIDNQEVCIPIEEVVNVESNLKPSVLKKIMFQLGLSFTEVEPYDYIINKMLKFRNNVAHGAFIDGIPSYRYGEIRKEVETLMEKIMMMIYDALKSEDYRIPVTS